MAARQSFSGKAAIVGVGYTDFSRDSGRSVLHLALEAIGKAVADAGLERHAIDGLLSYAINDSVPVATVARALGLSRYRWHADYAGGGSLSASILTSAAMAIEAGLAETIVVYRALNGRTGKRMGQIGAGAGDGSEAQFVNPYGMLGPVHMFAMTAQRYMYERDLKPAHLAELAVLQRSKAVDNPKALLRQPITVDDYFAAPSIASPLRRFDCCLETDGACALIVTTAERAKGLVARPVTIHAGVRAGGRGAGMPDKAGDDLRTIFSHYVAPALYDAAGMVPGDFDIAGFYDAYSFLLLNQLEDFGFCTPGEVGGIVTSGRIGMTGDLPVNTGGGMLCEGYVHGLNNIVETVEQLQGKAGVRQVKNATTALCTGFGGAYGSALVLTAER